VRVLVRAEHRTLSEADVHVGTERHRTGKSGQVAFRLAAGPATVTVLHVGFRPDTINLDVIGGLDTLITVDLVEQPQEMESIVVTSTRVAHAVEDEPTRVEVLGGEEIGEKTETHPSDLTQLLLEMSGVRVQPTAPGFGTASIRIQGLPGEYTKVMNDGLPLLGTQFGDFGLTQVPPLDLRQAEVIKGPATAMYGSSALGGVINLLSRLPDNENDLVVNHTSLAGNDAVLWLAPKFNDHLGMTLLTGVHDQRETDVNSDGWADVPGYRRVEFRPRVYWTPGGGVSVFGTIGGMSEARTGGTMPGAALPNGQPFPTAANTNRVDGGLVGTVPIHNDVLTFRASQTTQWDRQDFGPTTWYSTQNGQHQTLFSEATFTVPWGASTWVLGGGYEQDKFHSPDLIGFDYTFDVPGAFVQTTVDVSRHVSLGLAGRCDWHSQYGTFCSPRASLLVRASKLWAFRLAGATGYFPPTPFMDETDGVPLARLVPFNTPTIGTCSVSLCANDSGPVQTTSAFALQAEQARYASLDITRHTGVLDFTASLFASHVEHPVYLSDLNVFDERPQLLNAPTPTDIRGLELFAVYAHEPLVVLLEYAYLHSTSFSPFSNEPTELPLTPTHSGGLDIAWESDETNTRVAMHLFYTGAQAVIDDPYRTTTPPYSTLGLLISQRFGRFDVYLSGDNLTNLTQTHYDPIYALSPGDEVQWTTPQWAPLDGRTLNAGVRMRF